MASDGEEERRQGEFTHWEFSRYVLVAGKRLLKAVARAARAMPTNAGRDVVSAAGSQGMMANYYELEALVAVLVRWSLMLADKEEAKRTGNTGV